MTCTLIVAAEAVTTAKAIIMAAAVRPACNAMRRACNAVALRAGSIAGRQGANQQANKRPFAKDTHSVVP